LDFRAPTEAIMVSSRITGPLKCDMA
jgi:hypothetical protein